MSSETLERLDYLFDLRGYLVLKGALSREGVAACNGVLGGLRDTKPGEWTGYVQGAPKRCQFRYRDGRFMCGQINILMALNAIGAGEGATMVVPGRHKAHCQHPEYGWAVMASDEARSVGRQVS